VFSILKPKYWQQPVETAVNASIMGVPGYTWIFSQGSIKLTYPTFSLDPRAQGHLVRGLQGTGFIQQHMDRHDAYDVAREELSRSVKLQEEFAAHHEEPPLIPIPFTTLGHNMYHYTAYDSIVAGAIAACECERELFTGSEFFDQLMRTEFDGVSGRIAFQEETGARSLDGLKYSIDNMIVSDDLSSVDEIKFDSYTSSIVDLGNGSVETYRPFIYADSTPNQPEELPPIRVDMNLVSDGVIGLGVSLAAVVLLLSIGWSAWVFSYRERNVVKSSQPIFLIQLCVGTFLMGASIIPMSLQDPLPQKWLNFACMLSPWLLFPGFVAVVTALLAKTWRVNMIFNSGNGFRRVTVLSKDVAYPFCILMLINIILLSVWTGVAPLTWQRTPIRFDVFGREIETYGACLVSAAFSTSYSLSVFMIPIAAIDAIALIFA